MFLIDFIGKYKQIAIEYCSNACILCKSYYTNSSSSGAFFPDQNQPFEHTIRRTVQKFEETGSICSATCTYQRSAGSSENIADVRDSLEGNPNLSISRRS